MQRPRRFQRDVIVDDGGRGGGGGRLDVEAAETVQRQVESLATDGVELQRAPEETWIGIRWSNSAGYRET